MLTGRKGLKEDQREYVNVELIGSFFLPWRLSFISERRVSQKQESTKNKKNE
jgi:hypothetical protein